MPFLMAVKSYHPSLLALEPSFNGRSGQLKSLLLSICRPDYIIFVFAALGDILLRLNIEPNEKSSQVK